ncbi:MAG: acetyl-CoA carboxylase biotin carboxyl carrier protein subunit, partial [Puniceicoccaceae bacterium]
GDSVQEGDKLLTLEAMKMNTLVTSPQAGTIEKILVGPGDGVEEGQALLKLS